MSQDMAGSSSAAKKRRMRGSLSSTLSAKVRLPAITGLVMAAILLFLSRNLFLRIYRQQLMAREGLRGQAVPQIDRELPAALTSMLDDRFALFDPLAQGAPLRSADLSFVTLTVQNGVVEGGRDPFVSMLKRAIDSTDESVANQTVIFSALDFPSMIKAVENEESAIGAQPELAPQTSRAFYDIPFPTHTRFLFGMKFERIRKESLEVGGMLSWRDKTSAAVWRGKSGASQTGCGPLGARFFPSLHRDHCVDYQYPGYNPDLVGYTYGAELNTWRQHPRSRLVDLSLQRPKCDAGVKLDFRFVFNHNYWCADTVYAICVCLLAVAFVFPAAVRAAAQRHFKLALWMQRAALQPSDGCSRRNCARIALATGFAILLASWVVGDVPSFCKSTEDELLLQVSGTKSIVPPRMTSLLNLRRREGSQMVGKRMDYRTFARNRYVINVGNNGFADSFWLKLALGSVVLHVDTPYFEFFEPLLEPMVHYVPVKEDLSDLCDRLDYLERNPDVAETIAKRGMEFVRSTLTTGLVNRYVIEVLRRNADHGGAMSN